MEELVVWAWERDNNTWGLRGYESKFPDSDKLQKELGSRGAGMKGVIDMGWLQRVGRRVYRVTSAGLATYAGLEPAEPSIQRKAERRLEGEVTKILEHPVFRDWIKDGSKPQHFREAGYFWGIAPGTPSKTVRERVERVESTLNAALTLLKERGTEQIAASRGRTLFDRMDVERCWEFQEMLKSRFRRDLTLLDPSFAPGTSSESA
jgi:hypothetical protein